MNINSHITVASVLRNETDQFLFVQENKRQGLVINQPAGHWEPGEDLQAAVIRETLEETAWHFKPDAITGIYQWSVPGKDDVYFRFCFCGELIRHEPERGIDPDIDSVIWLTAEELKQQSQRHRSPLVQIAVDDYLAGKRYDLDLLSSL